MAETSEKCHPAGPVGTVTGAVLHASGHWLLMATTTVRALKSTEPGKRGLGSGSGGLTPEPALNLCCRWSLRIFHPLGKLRLGKFSEWATQTVGGLASLAPGPNLASCPCPLLSVASRKGLLSSPRAQSASRRGGTGEWGSPGPHTAQHGQAPSGSPGGLHPALDGQHGALEGRGLQRIGCEVMVGRLL